MILKQIQVYLDYTCSVLWSVLSDLSCFVYKNHHMAFACIHIVLLDYFECKFGAIILCVDFGASGDCEDCCYSPN